MSATDKNTRDLIRIQESTTPLDDTQLFRHALGDLYPGREIDDLTTDELFEALHLAQRRKAEGGTS